MNALRLVTPSGDRAGEEIDESEVPLAIRKYAVTVSGDDGVTESSALEPAPPGSQASAQGEEAGPTIEQICSIVLHC